MDKGGRTGIKDQLSMSARRTTSDILFLLPRRYYKCVDQWEGATSARFWIAQRGWPPRSHKGFGVASTCLFLVPLPFRFYLLPEGFCASSAAEEGREDSRFCWELHGESHRKARISRARLAQENSTQFHHFLRRSSLLPILHYACSNCAKRRCLMVFYV